MNKVTFTYKTGRQRSMTERDARLLQRLGKGTYLTRHMEAAQPVGAVLGDPLLDEFRDHREVAPDPEDVLSIDPEASFAEAPITSSSVDLDALDTTALHALAKERGVKVHHASGAEKVRAALREASQ